MFKLHTAIAVSLFAFLALTSSSNRADAQELLRGAPANRQQRQLFFGGLFGSDNDENNDCGFFGNLFCKLFRTCDDDEDSNPLGDLIEDILNTSDGSTLVRDALNKTRGSETPLRDFLGELLDQPESDTPVKDFVEEAFNRTDTPFLDFIADLFNRTKSRPIRDFVRDLINGTESPIEDALGDWLGGGVFGDLECPPPASDVPTCGYNVNGDEGVWVCRTLYNPFRGLSTNSTHCAHPDHTLLNNDKCGSCDGSYPAQCPCTCSVSDSGVSDGVYVAIKGKEPSCINDKFAISALNRYEGKVECIPSTECPV